MARTIDKRIMIDLIIEAKKTDPEAGPFSEWLAEYLVDHLPTLTPPNEPLMPDELKEMGGKPVWTVGVSYTDDGKWAMWDIVEKADDEGVDFGYSTESREWWNYNLRDKDGKLLNCAWVCYRRPPEGEEDT